MSGVGSARVILSVCLSVCRQLSFLKMFHVLLYFLYILHSTAIASLFFLLSVELVSYLKTFVPNQHQNDSKIFMCSLIKDFSAHAREYASGYKNAFSVHRASGLEILQNDT